MRIPKFVSELEVDDPESRILLPGFRHTEMQITMGTNALSLAMYSTAEKETLVSIALDRIRWTGSIKSLQQALLSLHNTVPY